MNEISASARKGILPTFGKRRKNCLSSEDTSRSRVDVLDSRRQDRMRSEFWKKVDEAGEKTREESRERKRVVRS